MDTADPQVESQTAGGGGGVSSSASPSGYDSSTLPPSGTHTAVVWSAPSSNGVSAIYLNIFFNSNSE